MNIRDYIEHLKRKPEPVRRQVAFGAAGALTFLIAIGWVTSFISSGVLAFNSGNGATINDAAQELQRETANLAGAAASINFMDAPSEITVVEGTASSTLDEDVETDATVIPF